jgi:hypothetical protein
MDKIHDQDVFNLLNWRRAHHVGEWRRDKKGKWVHRKPGPNAKLISPFTVNDTIEQLKKLFTYLKNTGVKLSNPPNFSNPKFWLPEPKARPRALSENERAGLNQALNTREDAELAWHQELGKTSRRSADNLMSALCRVLSFAKEQRRIKHHPIPSFHRLYKSDRADGPRSCNSSSSGTRGRPW